MRGKTDTTIEMVEELEITKGANKCEDCVYRGALYSVTDSNGRIIRVTLCGAGNGLLRGTFGANPDYCDRWSWKGSRLIDR